ncbi:MAG TPA: GntR family transcriptional regulator [Cerasibacillus sp.]|uniref:GntR family transcriptional regulator n=1 Tax=Cerasibacillus sp. TaxID=2498711 RepID=UPI002F42FF0E
MAIDKESFIPIYIQISEDLRTRILSGEYKNGDQLPSENDLAEQFGVTRTTIQRSLAILVNDGIIEKIHGKGSFVRLRPVRKNIWNFSSFSTYAKKANQVPVTEVINHEIFTVNQTNFLKLVRLRGFKQSDHNQWITLDTSILNLDMFPSLEEYDFSRLSLYDTLQNKFNTTPDHARLNVKAILADNKLMNYFGLDTPAPLLTVQGYVFDTRRRAIEEVHVVYNEKADFNVVISI